MTKTILHIYITLTMMFAYTNTTIKAIHQEKTTRYFINNTQVTEKQFKQKLENLEETGGWFCLDTNTGGITGYTCKDTSGQEYSYKCTTEMDKIECRINKIK